MGASCMHSLTTGNFNSAFGHMTMYASTTSSFNTAFGYQALTDNTTGATNSVLGANAMSVNTTGGSNSAVGFYALSDNTTGSFNTALGYGAGITQATGSNNVFIGYNAEPVSGNLNNAVAIGSLSRVGVSNAIVLGSISGVGGAGTTARVGIGTTTPLTRLHMKGGLSVEPAATVSVTSDGQTVTVSDNSFLMLDSDNSTATSRTVVLSDGLQTGQILIIECTGGAVEFLEGTSNAQVSATPLTLNNNDTALFIWDSVDWILISTHAN